MADMNGLPPRLSESLDNAAEESAQRRWSLEDIDDLLSDVTGGTIAEPQALQEEEVTAAPKREPEEIVVEELPVQMTTEETAPAADEIVPEEIIADEIVADDIAEQVAIEEIEAGEIRPEEITEFVPEPEEIRFDLFEEAKTRKLPIASAKPPKPSPSEQIEKPGVVLKRVDMQMTTDLSPVPRVLPAEKLLQREEQTPELDIPEGQQMLPDFEAEPPPRKLSPAELEAQLARSRQQRTNQFRALRGLGEKLEQSGETSEAPAPTATTFKTQKNAAAPAFEYNDPKRRDAVFHALRGARQKRSTAMLALMGAALLAVILQAFGGLIGTGTPQFLGPMAAFFLAGVLICGGDLIVGAKAMIARKPNADSLLLLAALLCLVQIIVLFVPHEGIAASHVTPLFLCLAAGHAAAKWMQARQRCDNFRFCAYTAAENLYALRLLDEGATPERTARQNLTETKTALPVPVVRPEAFVKESYRETAVDQVCAWLTPLALGIAMIIALSASLRGGATALESVSLGIAAAALSLCLCIPAAALLILAAQQRNLTKATPEHGVAILSTHAAEQSARSAAVVLDTRDLYVPQKGKMHGWREYWQVRTDEVLLYAAAIAIAAGGPLQAVFEGVIEGDYSVLPDVKGLTYEDRMGLNCRIHNQPVFFGNRNLLENHGVTVSLTEKEEQAYQHKGRRILYLAVEKRLTAFFVVSYAPDASLGDALRHIEHEDAEILLCNSDPCVSAENLADSLRLEHTSVTLLRSAVSDGYRKQMASLNQSDPAGVYHVGNARAFLRAVSACMNLRASINRLRLFMLAGSFTTNALLLGVALTGQLSSTLVALAFIGVNAILAAFMYAGTRP